MQMQNYQFMTEIVRQPTRGSSCLDVCFTNSPDKFLNVEIQVTDISDHKLVFARTIFESLKSRELSSQGLTRTGTVLDQLNFFDREVNWDSIDQAIADLNWDVELLNEGVGVIYFYI